MLAQMDYATAWKRLGPLLEQRRVEMAPRYRNRALFCKERGIDYRLTYDIEAGARTNFRRPTLRAIEVAYALQPGTIDDFVAGTTDQLAVREPAAPLGLNPGQRQAVDAFREMLDLLQHDTGGKRANGGSRG